MQNFLGFIPPSTASTFPSVTHLRRSTHKVGKPCCNGWKSLLSGSPLSGSSRLGNLVNDAFELVIQHFVDALDLSTSEEIKSFKIRYIYLSLNLNLEMYISQAVSTELYLPFQVNNKCIVIRGYDDAVVRYNAFHPFEVDRDCEISLHEIPSQQINAGSMEIVNSPIKGKKVFRTGDHGVT